MRTAAAIGVLVLGGAGFAFSSGLGNAIAGGLPTIPTVTTVKVPVPVPTVPVTVPKVTPPPVVSHAPRPAPVPAPAPVPKPKAPAPSVPSVPSVPAPAQSAVTSATRSATSARSQSLPAPQVTASGSGSPSSSSSGSASTGWSAQGGSTSSSSSSPSSSTSRASISRLRASRPWISSHGRRKHRTAILIFRLTQASRVVFTATEVSPSCRVAGSFSVLGHPGLNRFAFRGRVNGRTLAPGTYRISARVPGRGTVLRVTVVIVDSGVPSASQLSLARRSDVCSAAARGLAGSTAGTVANGSGTRAEAASISAGTNGGNGGSSAGPTSGTEGAQVTIHSAIPSLPGRVSKNVRNPLVIFALAAAILLLGLAALPKTAIPDPRLTDVLVRHRVEVALAGAAALTAALIALALA